jgi:hypothetical protein
MYNCTVRLPTRSKMADQIFHPRVALAESDQEVQYGLSVTIFDSSRLTLGYPK